MFVCESGEVWDVLSWLQTLGMIQCQLPRDHQLRVPVTSTLPLGPQSQKLGLWDASKALSPCQI